jgi:hypothetical protein
VSARRYAEGTAVPAAQSRQEIERLLAAHGVSRMAWGTGPDGDVLQFELRGHRYKFAIRRPTQIEWNKATGRGTSYWDIWREAEWRRRWRAHVLLLKAKIEFGEGDDEATDRELLPYLLLPDNRTLADWASGEGYAEIARGGMPAFPLLLGAGDGR